MKISINDAIKLLKQGEIVALPTETVYGLAASIYNQEALKKIFLTKERPLFDPLIVHVTGLDMAQSISLDWSELEVFLANSFWPGPLTFIKLKNNIVSDLITASLPSVGIRAPNHPIFQKVLNDLSFPIAAPSANKFKSTSPTSYIHVEQEFGSLVPVVDGGNCEVGIESTILELKNSQIYIYRPGIITKEIIQNKLSNTKWKNITITYANSDVAPGQLKEHYRPKKPITIYLVETLENTFYPNSLSEGNIRPLSQNPALAARELYAHIRDADLHSNSPELKLYFLKNNWEKSDWYPIRERLEKAATSIVNQ